MRYSLRLNIGFKFRFRLHLQSEMSTTALKNLKIRKAILNDAEAIAKVHVQSWQETYRGHIADSLLDNLSLESRTLMWTDAMNNVEQDKHLFVAELQNEIIAFISGGRLRNDDNSLDTSIETELYAIYCLNAYQGLNIGKLLVKQLIDAFVEVGYQKMLVWVLTSNPSKHFYMHLGAGFYTEKELTIGDASYQEQAYVWSSLQDLQMLLKA